MDSTIVGTMNNNINMDSTIVELMNDNINMDSTIVGLTTHYFHLYYIPLISNSNTYINKQCFIFKG